MTITITCHLDMEAAISLKKSKGDWNPKRFLVRSWLNKQVIRDSSFIQVIVGKQVNPRSCKNPSLLLQNPKHLQNKDYIAINIHFIVG
ncbi:unnamed protein product, partial [Prunus brigantina]